jgi:hypothetical protein
MSGEQAPAHANGQHATAATGPRREPTGRAGRPRARRWHRGPKGADLLDLIFKIRSRDGWSATLRNNPSVVLVSDNGDDLARLTHDLALAILEGHGPETLLAMRSAGTALPAPDPETEDPGSAADEPRRPDHREAESHPVTQAS